jgi:cytidine deaminase
MTAEKLLELAEVARERSYSPYSGFCVGAALLTKDGEVFMGCNIENASYSPTCCAERVALFSAVSAGKREFEAIAIVGAKRGEVADAPCYPCGVCRQVLSEFCGKDMKIYLSGNVSTTLGDLLPNAFDLL